MCRYRAGTVHEFTVTLAKPNIFSENKRINKYLLIILGRNMEEIVVTYYLRVQMFQQSVSECQKIKRLRNYHRLWQHQIV